MMLFKFGIELELLVDQDLLINSLINNNIKFVQKSDIAKNKENCLVIKPEITLRDPLGIELNFPPNYTISDISKVLNILKLLPVTFNSRCAMHIHVSFDELTEETISRILSYYIEHQTDIIEEAKLINIFADLNELVSMDNFNKRRICLNTIRAYKKYSTIEHRIYKSTIDIDKILFALNQTKSIIKAALY